MFPKAKQNSLFPTMPVTEVSQLKKIEQSGKIICLMTAGIQICYSFMVRDLTMSKIQAVVSLGVDGVFSPKGVLQSSQVDLLAKSEICNCSAVVCDATGVTPLGGSGGMLPQEILKNGSS